MPVLRSLGGGPDEAACHLLAGEHREGFELNGNLEVPAAGLAAILLGKPRGLCVGKVRLDDGEETLGVLGTQYGGWRAYVAARGKS